MGKLNPPLYKSDMRIAELSNSEHAKNAPLHQTVQSASISSHEFYRLGGKPRDPPYASIATMSGVQATGLGGR